MAVATSCRQTGAGKHVARGVPMPTTGEAKASEQPKPQVEPVRIQEPELFAAEIEMGKKSSNFLPMLFITGLLIVVGGTVYYFVKGANNVLTVPAATSSITEILK